MCSLDTCRTLELTWPAQRTEVAKPTVLPTWRRLKYASLPLFVVSTNGVAQAELTVDPFLQPDDPRTVAEGDLYSICAVRFSNTSH